jgi:hypothetical protein
LVQSCKIPSEFAYDVFVNEPKIAEGSTKML